jgi:hypothetical protein
MLIPKTFKGTVSQENFCTDWIRIRVKSMLIRKMFKGTVYLPLKIWQVYSPELLWVTFRSWSRPWLPFISVGEALNA